MRALYIRDGNLQYLADYPQPVRRAGQSLIQVIGAGVCSTDLEIVRGYAGFQGIPGHEFVGVVRSSDNQSLIGKRVVGGINLGCGVCEVCQGHGPEHCPKRTVLGIIDHDGAFADYLTLPDENLHLVPDDISDEAAIFTEPLAAALRISEQVSVKPSDRIAVVGPGKLGLLIGQVLSLGGGDVTMLGRRTESLRLPADLGLTTGLVEDEDDNTYEFVVEATGNEAGFAHSVRLLRPQGTLILKSTFAGLATVDLSELVVSEMTIIGSRCGPFEPALRLLSAGKVNVESMIEGRYSLSDGLRAFEHAAQPGVRKILINQ